MVKLTEEFREKIVQALFKQRNNFEGTDEKFAKQYGINKSIYSRLKKGDRGRMLDDNKWLNIGRLLNVSASENKWNMAKTDVFRVIEQDIRLCQKLSTGRILVDDVGIGKTYAAKYLSRTLKNCFYVDAKQARTKMHFIRLIAKTIGVESKGRYVDVKENLKYYLKTLTKPVIIIDDSGYLDDKAHLDLMEMIDGTKCGWYQIGDESLQRKIERNINNKKIGYRAMFSRHGKRFSTIIPTARLEKLAFYKQMIKQVFTVNMENTKGIDQLVKRCLVTDDNTSFGDLRRAESLLLLMKEQNAQ